MHFLQPESFNQKEPHRRCFYRIVESMIFSSNRRNSMPRPLSSCKHRHSCSPSKSQSHTMDQIHTIMSKVAQDMETLQRHPASFSNVRDASPDTGVGPESRCKIVFKKRGWFHNGHRQVGSSLPPKWSIFVDNIPKASDAPPIG